MISAIVSSPYWFFYIVSIISVFIVIYNIYRFIIGKDSILPFIFYPEKGKTIDVKNNSDVIPCTILIIILMLFYICPIVNVILYTINIFTFVIRKLINMRNINVTRYEEDLRKNNNYY